MEDVDHLNATDYVLELLSAILLSLATVASTWSAYESTRWSGVQANSYSQAAAFRATANKMTTVASRKIEVDVGIFLEYLVAVRKGDSTLSRFLFDRFRPELSAATKAWIATKPLKNPQAPRSPFDMKEYKIPELQASDALTDSAEQSSTKAKAANQTSDNYVLLTVLFAAVFFFAGIHTKLRRRAMRIAILAMGIFVFCAATIVLSTYPIH